MNVSEILGNQKFLDCCKNNMSSNPGEAYHHVLLGLTPKDSYCSTQEFQLAINISIPYSTVKFYRHIKNHLMNMNL